VLVMRSGRAITSGPSVDHMLVNAKNREARIEDVEIGEIEMRRENPQNMRRRRIGILFSVTDLPIHRCATARAHTHTGWMMRQRKIRISASQKSGVCAGTISL
jgi:hypothetical protein